MKSPPRIRRLAATTRGSCAAAPISHEELRELAARVPVVVVRGEP